MVKGLSREQADRLTAARGERPFRSVAELAGRTGLSRSALKRLADADAFRSMGLDRRQALWRVLALDERPDATCGDIGIGFTLDLDQAQVGGLIVEQQVGVRPDEDPCYREVLAWDRPTAE